MNRIVRLAAAVGVLLAGCGDRSDHQQPGADNYVPPVPQAPTPVAGQGQTTPLAAYVGHYPNDAVDGVSFFDRTEVANALVDLEPDAAVRKLVTGRDATTVPIFTQGDRIATHGCEPHDCADHNWTLLIARNGNRDHAELCVHDTATSPGVSRWSNRSGTRPRAGDCPQG